MRLRRSWPVLVLLLVPAVSAGCSAIPGWPTATPGRSADAQAPTGDSWVIVAEGSPTPLPGAGLGAASPSAGPTSGFLPLGSPGPVVTASPTCAGTQRTDQINGLTVVPGAGSAVVSWYNAGGANLVSYRLTAIPQRLVAGSQPDLTWQTIPPGPACRMITVSVADLVPGAPYKFSLDAVVTSVNSDGTRSSTVGRSDLIYPT